MNKRMLTTLSLGVSLLVSMAWAQFDDPMPLEPLDVPQEAYVRFVQASPNASLERWRLEGEFSFADSPAGEELAFMEVGEYVTIESGRYQLDALMRIGGAAPMDAAAPVGVTDPVDDEDAEDAEEAEETDAEEADAEDGPEAPSLPLTDLGPSEQLNVEAEFVFNAGRSYTIVLSGLMVPTSIDDADADNGGGNGGGFMGWLRGLFGGGNDDRDALALHAQLLEDGDEFLELPNGRVRVVHAAPGTDAIDLVPRDGSAPWLRDLSFGDASNFRNLDDFSGLDLRMSGSELVLFGLDEVSASPNTTYTVILVGTPVESVPLAVITTTTR